MKIFEIVGSDYFKALTGKYQNIFIDCLEIIYHSYRTELSYGVDREILISLLTDYFEKNSSDDIQFEDGQDVFHDSRSKANEFLRKLKGYGWIEYEFDNSGYAKIVMLSHSISIMQTFTAITDHNEMEYQSEVSAIYSLLTNEKLLLDTYSKKHELLTRFCTAQRERISKNKKPEYFDGNIAEFEKLLKAVSMVFEVKEEMFIRDFSIKVFGDSKTFEAIKGKVKRLLFQYGDFPDEDTVLEYLNIVKNPGHIFMKGSGVINISGQSIDLSKLGGDIAISSSILKDIEKISITGRMVITIENLTSFNAFSEDNTFAIYLGGYHNTHRRNFIMQLFHDNPETEFFHFGDIDAGGFYILLHLREKTGVPFRPYHMDISTLQKYSAYAKPLTENDKKRLERLSDTVFSDTIKFMLENNCKLEQEAIDS
ncbi:MAG: hypothetical protein IJ740_07020 [Ruminococcus sp.]|nr:hypothetical protein [Ruminococcus sp.]